MVYFSQLEEPNENLIIPDLSDPSDLTDLTHPVLLDLTRDGCRELVGKTFKCQ